MPDLYGVVPRRHIGQLEASGVVRHRKIGALRRNQPALHPAVHVAFYLDDLGLVDLLFHRFLELWLRHVKWSIYLAIGMDVMENPVRIDDLNRRTGWESQNVGMVFAILLI